MKEAKNKKMPEGASALSDDALEQAAGGGNVALGQNDDGKYVHSYWAEDGSVYGEAVGDTPEEAYEKALFQDMTANMPKPHHGPKGHPKE